MAKKKSSNRPNVSAETLERARAELRGERQATPADGTPKAGAKSTAKGATPGAKGTARAGFGLATRRVPSAEELKAEYAYVTQDLRKLMMVAGLLFAVVIVTALVVLPAIA
jgi:hypothetical protein